MAAHSIELVSNNNECVHRRNMVRALSCYRSTRAVKGIHSIFRIIFRQGSMIYMSFIFIINDKYYRSL